VRGVLDAAALAVPDVPVAGLLADRLLVARLLADELLVAGLLVAGRVVEDRPPAGDGVRVAGWVVAPGDDVSGVGVKVDGTEEPPDVQAEAVTASRTAPAARRPAASHASRVAAGVLSRIFMGPPRTTRVRCTR
jgi:hypothetical protein